MLHLTKTGLRSREPYFFLLVTGLNLIPLLSVKFFPTLDGAAHLYNSQLILSLLTDDNSTLSSFFSFNEEPIPNWTGHAVMSFLKILLPAFVAEKMLLLTYMIGLPLAFRSLVNAISPHGRFMSYLVFPFTYSTIFFLGFYNFLLALVFLFFTLAFWIKLDKNPISLKGTLKLAVLVTVTYFSHIFVFGILLLLLGLYLVYEKAIEVHTGSKPLRAAVQRAFQNIAALVIASFLPLVLAFRYFYSRASSGDSVYLSRNELVLWLTEIRPTIALVEADERVFTVKLFYLMVVLTVIVVFTRAREVAAASMINKELGIRSSLNMLVKSTDFWLMTSLILLLMYFILPDSDGSAGYVSMRLALMFFLFYIVWLSAQKLKIWYGIIATSAALLCTFGLNTGYLRAAKELDSWAQECHNVSEHILQNSIVLPINFSGNWLHSHFSNYLGVDKPMVILENYECSTGYFPLVWNDASVPNTLLGKKSIDDFTCIKWKSNTTNAPKTIDFVFVLGDAGERSDSCFYLLEQTLTDAYKLTYTSERFQLYKTRKQ